MHQFGGLICQSMPYLYERTACYECYQFHTLMEKNGSHLLVDGTADLYCLYVPLKGYPLEARITPKN